MNRSAQYEHLLTRLASMERSQYTEDQAWWLFLKTVFSQRPCTLLYFAIGSTLVRVVLQERLTACMHW